MNFCRSLAGNPSALPLRSRLRNSLVPYSFSHLPVFTAPRRSPMIMGRCWIPTGHWNSQLPQVVHWNAASSEMCVPSSGASLAGPEFVQVAAQAQNDFLGVEHLAGIVGGTMLGAAPHSTAIPAANLTISMNFCKTSFRPMNPRCSGRRSRKSSCRSRAGALTIPPGPPNHC